MKGIPVEHAPFDTQNAARGPVRPPNAARWDRKPSMARLGLHARTGGREIPEITID
jgi:hypothetical protein